MQRRQFIALLGSMAAAWPLAARAQQPGKVSRIGVLIALAQSDPEARAWVAGFLQGLEKRGWSEDRNLHVDYRFAAAGAQAQVFAKELVSLQPDVIFAMPTPAVAALQRETQEIPIVFAALADPIGSGFIASLPQPGGNITGVMQYEPSVSGKWLSMLKDIAPRLARVAFVLLPRLRPSITPTCMQPIHRLSHSGSNSYRPLPKPPSRSTAPSSRLRACRMAGYSCLRILRPSPIAISSLRSQLGTVCRRSTHFVLSSLPVVSRPDGIDVVDACRRAAFYVDRILRGDKPADLPVQAATKFRDCAEPRNGEGARADGAPGPARGCRRSDRMRVQFCCGANGRSWPKADIEIAWANVRFRG